MRVFSLSIVLRNFGETSFEGADAVDCTEAIIQNEFRTLLSTLIE